MQIQISIPEDLNKEMKRYKLDFDLNNLQEVVIKILSKELLKKEAKNGK